MTPQTLAQLLDTLRESPARVVFPGTGEVLPHRDIPGRAAAAARLLTELGVGAPDVVGLLVPASVSWLPSYFGVALTGAAVAALPLPPVVLDPIAAARQLSAVVDAAGIRHIVASGSGLAVGRELAHLRTGIVIIDAGNSSGGGAPPPSLPDLDPDAPAAVQFSSGSTARPKGVLLTHRALLAGVDAINTHIRTVADDVLVQWVPLFHDMGTVALLCSLLAPCDAHLFSPTAFIRDPAVVLSHIADVGGSIVTGPNFSYDAFVRAAGKAFGDDPGPDRLARWRLALNGSESVKADTVRAFTDTFTPLGAAPTTMYPCYGMAEATLAITLPELGTAPRVVIVDRRALTPGERVRQVSATTAEGRELVGLGVPVPQMRVRVCGADGNPFPDGTLGEIHINGPAVTTGYLNDDPNTRQALVNGWLRTGDLGFFDHGELFVAGRLKEMIVVHGRNYFAEDVEQAVCGVPGIYKGNCVAIADPHEERIVVVAEVAKFADAGVRERVASDILAAAGAAGGPARVRVVTIPPRGLPRTTSGKWQRSLVAKLITDIWREHNHV
ncbi:MAG: hypothetical protein QOH97_5024 [Actinoplanes sp.]|jgi:acyl-CoA synthetase (AMP-forming)/AMP-acid ligase II|nr:hypothetical protein [Actinoplanes sp.]